MKLSSPDAAARDDCIKPSQTSPRPRGACRHCLCFLASAVATPARDSDVRTLLDSIETQTAVGLRDTSRRRKAPTNSAEEKLEQGLEESMAGSDPVSITQPTASGRDTELSSLHPRRST
jgi:hypothetical protein